MIAPSKLCGIQDFQGSFPVLGRMAEDGSVSPQGSLVMYGYLCLTLPQLLPLLPLLHLWGGVGTLGLCLSCCWPAWVICDWDFSAVSGGLSFLHLSAESQGLAGVLLLFKPSHGQNQRLGPCLSERAAEGAEHKSGRLWVGVLLHALRMRGRLLLSPGEVSSIFAICNWCTRVVHSCVPWRSQLGEH